MIIHSCLLFFFLVFIQATMNFQRNIWVYWETDIQKAPLVTRISYEKLSIAAKKANWNLVLINGNNVKLYLKDYERFQQVVKKGHRNTVQQKSDILRISLVQQNGGIWIDFACILFDDLQWLSNEKIFEHMLINRIGKNLDDPDMFMLGEGWHQSPLSYYNSDGVLVNDEYFGMAIHFIAAKKKSPIMKAWKNKMYDISSKRYQQILPEIMEKRFYFHNIDRGDVYYSGNIALQSVIQEKQFELDDRLSLLNSKRQNAYEHFKIWMIHGEVGPIAMTRKHLLNVRDLFMETKQQIQIRAGRLWFYLKLAKFLRQDIENLQKPSEAYFSQNKNLTVEQIINRGPKNQQCSFYYIVQGSILYNFYKGSKYAAEIYTPFISVKQRQKLKQYCAFISPNVYFSSYSRKSQGQLTQPQRQLFYQPSASLVDKIKLLWLTNSLVFFAGLEQWRAVLCFAIFYIILRNSSFKQIIQAFLNRFKSQSGEKVSVYQFLRSKMNGLQKFNAEQLNIQYSEMEWSFTKTKVCFFVVTKSILAAISLQFYQNFQDHGKYPQYEWSLMILGLLTITDVFLNKMVQNMQECQSLFISLETVRKAIRFSIYLPIGFVTFIHLDILYGLAYYHCLLIVGGGMLIYILLEQVEKTPLNNWFFITLKGLLGIAKWINLVLFAVFYIFPNLRYIRENNHYVKQSLSQIALQFLTLVFITTILTLNFSFIKYLVNRLQQQAETDGKRNGMREKIIHLVISNNMLGMFMYRTQVVYSQILKGPSWYNHILYFQILTLLFIVFAFSFGLRMPQELQARRKILIYILLYGLIILYLANGMNLYQKMNWILAMITVYPMSFYTVFICFLVEQISLQQQQVDKKSRSNDVPYEIVLSYDQIKQERRRQSYD